MTHSDTRQNLRTSFHCFSNSQTPQQQSLSNTSLAQSCSSFSSSVLSSPLLSLISFSPKERFCSSDLLSTSFDGPPLRRLHPLSPFPSPSSCSLSLSLPLSHHHPPHLLSLTTPCLFCGPAWVAEFNEFSFLSLARR